METQVEFAKDKSTVVQICLTVIRYVSGRDEMIDTDCIRDLAEAVRTLASKEYAVISFVTINEAASLYKVSEEHIFSLILSRHIRTFDIGGEPLVSIKELEQYISSMGGYYTLD